MLYNFKRALGISFCLYIATFVVGIVVGIICNVDTSSINNTPQWFWYVGMVSAVILTAVFAKWYFKNPAIIPSAKSGFLFGITAIILSSVLDWIMFSIGNASGANVNLAEYYGNYNFWIILFLVVATAKLIGHMKGSKVPKV